ncbi:hypothetical protein SCHPADRAFT_995772 [Schizopora paradoxa]|uniref:SUZ domain-containing protein n=1 Tax=Schizopora paradoxa TaxID=27342 RepID=A0A0H2RU44_9AGAM|nr:hypothetical protein SCHPADRAFT_995772 [Schizopora paradoxa]
MDSPKSRLLFLTGATNHLPSTLPLKHSGISSRRHVAFVTKSIVNPRPSRTKDTVVVDDWDADGDDDGEVDANTIEEEKEKVEGAGFPGRRVNGIAENEAIWEAANAKAPAPKIDVVAATSLRPGAFVPPPELFQAPIRILKRPEASKETISQGPKTLSKEEQERQLREKEAEYVKARERIFGASSSSVSVDSSKSESQTSDCTEKSGQLVDEERFRGVTVIRNPTGPSPSDENAGDGKASRGFGGRRGKRRGKKETRT